MMQRSATPRHRRPRDGQEARTAIPVAAGPKALLAAGGVLLCGALGVLAWTQAFTVLAIILFVLAGLALIDLSWQFYKMYRTRVNKNSHA